MDNIGSMNVIEELAISTSSIVSGGKFVESEEFWKEVLVMPILESKVSILQMLDITYWLNY